MIEVEATVHLPRLGRGHRAIVDETDLAVKKQIRCGNLRPTGRELEASETGEDDS
jgi:hypothetical protein